MKGQEKSEGEGRGLTTPKLGVRFFCSVGPLDSVEVVGIVHKCLVWNFLQP